MPKTDKTKTTQPTIAPSHFKFQTFPYADISTKYVDQEDLKLLLDTDAPNHLANTNDCSGSFFWVSEDDETFKDQIAASAAYGFSPKFIHLLQCLKDQKIPYVRFDADGGDVEGMESN